MLIITKLNQDKINIKAHYYYARSIRKCVPSAIFDEKNKCYIVDKKYLSEIETSFKGSVFYKTPKWVILGENPPDMSKMYTLNNPNLKLPELKLPLYKYQQYGVRFMIEKLETNHFVLNADDVGLGKTFQTIATLKHYIENKGMKKILIICKKTIKEQWLEEIQKFTDLDKTFYMDYTKETKKKRLKTYEEMGKHDKWILITNYHSFLNDTPYFKKLNAEFVIIDEVHSVKCRTGVLNNNIQSVCKGKYVIFLTGTPIMSKPEDMFGIVQIASDDYFGKWNEFVDKHLVIADTGYGPTIVGAKNMDILREKIQNGIIRRTINEVDIEIPKTIIQNVRCKQDSSQVKVLKAIDEMRSDLMATRKELIDKKQLTDIEVQKLEKIEACLKGLISVEQAASSDLKIFSYSNSGFARQFCDNIPVSYKMSPKTEHFLDIIEDIIQSDSKIIVFTKFRMVANMLKDRIKETFNEDVLLYTGAENEESRNDAKRDFWENPSRHVLIGTDAMAEGVNLQCANYVLNYDLPDTAAIYIQRIGRIRRTSSKFNHVTVYNMLTENSKDINKMNNIENNYNVMGAFVDIDEAQREALIAAMEGK